jgi:5-hydroxyisourate hydrolase
MSGITTHILDTSLGRPAGGVAVVLELYLHPGGWREMGKGETDADGRLRTLLPPDQAVAPGVYRLTFHTGAYFMARMTDSFFPEVSIVFTVQDPTQHYHVPLLLSPFGYSTYRGS